jgi:hypothetical protein
MADPIPVILDRKSSIENRKSLQAGADGIDHGLLIGELAGFQLRVNQVAVHLELEAASIGWNQFELVKLLLVSTQQLGRQTDGLRLVISLRTISQFQVHDRSPFVHLLPNYNNVS